MTGSGPNVRVKIFADRTYVPDGLPHVVMLYPFWGKNPEDSLDPTLGCFDRYVEVGASLFEMSTLADADVAVLPVPWEDSLRDATAGRLASAFLHLAADAAKPVIAFFLSDSDDPIDIDNSLIFRTSLRRSSRRHNEFAMPAWSEDFVERYLGGQVVTRPKREKPVVGFCGYVPDRVGALGEVAGRLRRVGRRLFRGAQHHSGNVTTGARVRRQALAALNASQVIDTNFLIRREFFDGALSRSGRIDWARMRAARRAFVQNLVDSDYTLCVRGTGNFSYRLYETLCCGRVPVFVDTDCVLPLEDEVDWRAHCIWVDEGHLDTVGDVVARFHDGLSDRDFLDLQRDCRRLWERYVRPAGFFGRLQPRILRS